MKMKKRNIAVLSVVCAGIAGSALAADNNYRSYPMMYMTLPDTKEKTFNVAGLVEPIFVTSTSRDVADGKDYQNNFSFDRLRVGFNGSFSENLDYFFMSEWAPNAVTKSTGGGANAFIAQATFKKVFGTANLGVGSMVVPMGLSYYAPTTHVPWITYADIEYNLYGAGSINGAQDITGVDPSGNSIRPNVNQFSNIWKPGIMLFDQHKLDNGGSLTYTAGIYNTTGTAFSDNTTKQKDFNGTLEYKQGNLLAMYGTRIGNTTESNPGGKERSRVRHAVTLVYNDFKKDKWWLWAEYMHAKDEQDKTLNQADLKADGFFVAAGFRPTPKFELVARHSQFDRDKDSNDSTRKVNSLIANYTRNDGIRIQAQFNKASEDNWTKATRANTVYPNDTFVMRFSVPISAKLK